MRRSPSVCAPNSRRELSGRSAVRVLTGLVHRGYDIRIFYLWLPSPDLAVARVRHRVEGGGHDIPEPVIRRRFQKSLINFDSLYRPLASTWRLYDGSTPGGYSLIAHGTGAREPVIADRVKWTMIRRQIGDIA